MCMSTFKYKLTFFNSLTVNNPIIRKLGQLIYKANQLTSFLMIGILSANGLNLAVEIAYITTTLSCLLII